MFFGHPFAGLPLFRAGARLPASAAGWMAQRGPAPPNWNWLRAQAYRKASQDPRQAAQWRAQFEALARNSWQKYRQTVPGAGKLVNPAGMQAILRDLQNARVSINDMQVRAKAAELRVITSYLRRPDVARVRVVPSSSAGRTPDLVVSYNDGRPPERVEIRTLTGSSVGWRRSPGVPGTRGFDTERLARAIDAKVRRGQLTATVRGVAPGGTIAVRMEAPPTQAGLMARQAMQALARRLAGAPEVRRVEIHLGDRLIRFERQPDGSYRPHTVPRLAPGEAAARPRRQAPGRRRGARPRRGRR